MRPLKLEFQAIGPYKGHEIIDFTDLKDNKLFLICGETGSGKTMILDAMTFALYGKDRSDVRTDFKSLRCDKTEFGTDSFIKFTFENNDTTYLFERYLICKRTDINESQNVFIVDNEGRKEQVFENCKSQNINSYAEDVIGLTREQFRQVIVLPQGKFETFLTANSDEKQKILSDIFNTKKWSNYANKYYENAKQRVDKLNEDNKTVKNTIQVFNCNTISDFNLKLQEAKEERIQINGDFEKIEYDKRIEQINKQKDVLGKFKSLDDFQNTFNKLNSPSKKEEIKNLENTIEYAKRANDTKEVVTNYNDAKKEKYDRQKHFDEIENINLPKCKKEYASAEKELEEFLNNQTEYDSNKNRIILLGSKKDVYEKNDNAKKELDESNEKLAKANKKALELDGQIKTVEEEILKSKKEHDSKLEKSQELFDAYNRNICGILAEDLEDNKPCPVCGSLNHPHKATKSNDAVTYEEYKKSKKEADDSHDKWEKLNKAHDALNDKKSELNLEKLNANFITAQTSYNSLIESKEEGIDTLDDLNKEIDELNKYVNNYEIKEKELKDELDKKGQNLTTCEANKKSARVELNKASEKLEKCESALKKVLEKNQFASIEEAKSYMIDNDELDKYQDKISRYNQSLSECEKNIDDLLEKLSDKEKPDEKAIELKSKELEEIKSKYDQDVGRINQEIDSMQDISDEINEIVEYYEDNIQEANDDLNFAKSLRGDTSLGIERYVLAIMFNKVIFEANHLLKKVHGGRYTLFRSDESSGLKHKKGLELKVHDAYTPDDEDGRSVSMLSGGEKFLVSLALAIGMSTVAQKSGVKIDAMFIDEGFGTLDDDSIDDALDVLQSVQNANGIVGIISHVQLLEDNINEKIIVEKKKSGSTLKVNF